MFMLEMTRKFSDIKNDLFIEQVKELNEGVYDPSSKHFS